MIVPQRLNIVTKEMPVSLERERHADIQALWEKKNHREKETVHLEMQNAITAANKVTLLQTAK